MTAEMQRFSTDEFCYSQDRLGTAAAAPGMECQGLGCPGMFAQVIAMRSKLLRLGAWRKLAVRNRGPRLPSHMMQITSNTHKVLSAPVRVKHRREYRGSGWDCVSNVLLRGRSRVSRVAALHFSGSRPLAGWAGDACASAAARAWVTSAARTSATRGTGNGLWRTRSPMKTSGSSCSGQPWPRASGRWPHRGVDRSRAKQNCPQEVPAEAHGVLR